MKTGYNANLQDDNKEYNWQYFRQNKMKKGFIAYKTYKKQNKEDTWLYNRLTRRKTKKKITCYIADFEKKKING